MKELITLAVLLTAAWLPLRILALAILAWLVRSVVMSHRTEAQAALASQITAQAAKARAIRALRTAPWTAELDRRRLELSLSPTKDPDVDGLSASAYIAMRDAWASLANDAIDATIEARYKKTR